MTTYDTYFRDVLAVFQKHPQQDFLASEVAPLVGGDVDRACMAMLDLAQHGWLVAARITRTGGGKDVQGRLSLVTPLEGARAAALASVTEVGATSDARLKAVSADSPQPAEARPSVATRLKWRPPRLTDRERVAARVAQRNTTIKVGLFSDGSMELTRGEEVFRLAPEETRQVFDFLDRFSTLALEEAS